MAFPVKSDGGSGATARPTIILVAPEMPGQTVFSTFSPTFHRLRRRFERLATRPGKKSSQSAAPCNWHTTLRGALIGTLSNSATHRRVLLSPMQKLFLAWVAARSKSALR